MFPYVDLMEGSHIANVVSVKLQNGFKFMFRDVHGLKKKRSDIYDLTPYPSS